MAEPESVTEVGRLALMEEVPRILRRRRVTGGVRVSVTTTEAPGEVHTTRRSRLVEVERVPVDQEVESPPPVRQEGDLVIVPVLEERLVVVRRLVVTEEVRFRLTVEEEPVTLSLPLLRQDVSVTRLPPPDATASDDSTAPHGDKLMQRTLTAMFDTRAEAERAAGTLRGLGLGAENIRMHQAEADSGQGGTVATSAAGRREDRGFFGAIADLFMPDEDRATYSEGLRRGATLLLAEVDETRMHQAMDAMEAAGAVDLDAREADWRQQGWSGGSMAGISSGSVESSLVMPDTDARTGVDTGIPAQGSSGGVVTGGTHSAYGATAAGGGHAGMAGTGPAATPGARPNTASSQDLHGEQRIPMAEERLRVGKRESHAGRVRVRSYVVETPVEEQVTLREEHVHVQRVPADRAATASEANLFQDRVIEAEESMEEAVVQKDVRVTGEVVVNKDTTERTETVHDTVRRTEVDVDENAAANDPARRGRPGRTG
ncbi:YsnF/AvaK domain-containing protein [Falsiroseomonas sp. HC035]|uniref:YsnF/AvaK domain-containing protein n=1 Tax=Falsiroseomonas sp. HC035 TaxID=3390999 RepID=UPI003D321221